MHIFLCLNFVVEKSWLLNILIIPIAFITIFELGLIYNFRCKLIVMIRIDLFLRLTSKSIQMNPVLIINAIFFMCAGIIIPDARCRFSKSMI